MRLNSESIETILERFDRRDDADADYVMAHWREAVDVYEHDGSMLDHYWNFPGGRNSCMEFYSRPDFISESYVEWKAGLLSEGDLERTDRADTDPLGDPRAFGATTPTR